MSATRSSTTSTWSRHCSAKGARFVDEVHEIPEGAITVFSAHGVAESVELAAHERGLRVIDAACPLVTKVHKEGHKYAANGFDVVLIGHAGHPEVEGTMGRIKGRVHLISTVEDVAGIEPSDPERLAFVTQTTLSFAFTPSAFERSVMNEFSPLAAFVSAGVSEPTSSPPRFKNVSRSRLS